MTNIFSVIKHKLFSIILYSKIGYALPDKIYIQLIYLWKFGKIIDLNNPKTYNEKLNWMKLYDHNPLYTSLVDKYAVKEWVAKKIGYDYIIPTLGIWDAPESIDWDRLPNQFVLKTTHGGGGDGVIICKDKKTFNTELAIQKLKVAMRTDPYLRLREWPYKNVPHRIIAEVFMKDANSSDLKDYKFFAFNGKVKALFVASDRQNSNEEVKFDFFDADFNRLDLKQKHPMSSKYIEKPKQFELMKEIASKLSEGLPEVRCDLYEINGKVYFGELTFFHHGAIVPFVPKQWDYIFGGWIDLPKKI